jgi:hypothetical protein
VEPGSANLPISGPERAARGVSVREPAHEPGSGDRESAAAPATTGGPSPSETSWSQGPRDVSRTAVQVQPGVPLASTRPRPCVALRPGARRWPPPGCPALTRPGRCVGLRPGRRADPSRARRRPPPRVPCVGLRPDVPALRSVRGESDQLLHGHRALCRGCDRPGRADRPHRRGEVTLAHVQPAR